MSFSVCGGQFVVDQIIDTTLSFVDRFLKRVCENQPGYQSGCKHIFKMLMLLLSENHPNNSRDHTITLNLLCKTMRGSIDNLLTDYSDGLCLCNMEEKDDLNFDEGWDLEAQVGQAAQSLAMPCWRASFSASVGLTCWGSLPCTTACSGSR